MTGLPNPYVILAGVALLAAATTGAFLKGESVQQGEDAKAANKELIEALAQRDAKQTTIDALEKAAGQRESDRQTAVREIDRVIPQVIEKDRVVYERTCIDDNGVKLLDRAASTAAGHAGDGPGSAASASVGPAKGPAQH